MISVQVLTIRAQVFGTPLHSTPLPGHIYLKVTIFLRVLTFDIFSDLNKNEKFITRKKNNNGNESSWILLID